MRTKNLIKWAKDLYPLNRSLAGKFNRLTINYIKENINKKFKIKKVKSGTKVLSWKIPKEYSITKAILRDEKGKIICDIKDNYLHAVVNSISVNRWISYKKLRSHLFYSNEIENAIPYVTSYYKKNWGFCLSKKNFLKLDKKIKYKVDIKSNHKLGYMNYAELIIKGKSKKEILICSYICHPSLANNELSGILAISQLSKKLKKSKYTIRLLLIPETIGAIYFIKNKFNHIKKNLIFGLNLTCVGINGPYTCISTISENTYADKIVERIGSKYKNFKKISFNYRGSNERQFGCQNLKLPFVTLCRKKFGEYKQYHTSADNLSILKPKVIIETCEFVKKIVDEINANNIYKKKDYCEPFLANKNLIENIGTLKNMKKSNRKNISDFLAHVDINHDLKSLKSELKINNIEKLATTLEKKKLIKKYF